jgi:putative transcriptional regulator
LRHDRNSRVVARPHDRRDFLDVLRSHDSRRRTAETSRPVDDVAGDAIGVGQHVPHTNDVTQRGDHIVETHRRAAYEGAMIPLVVTPNGSHRGRLLIATPPLVDPNFDRTVVLLLEHGDEGALGIVLNRPSDTSLSEVLPEWHDHASAPAVVFIGGPVTPEAVIALARGGDEQTPGWVHVLGDLGTVDVGRDPLDVSGSLESLRVFVGYAGWAPGQLEAELGDGAWFVVDMRADDAFARSPDRLWRDVLRRQRGRIAMFAHCPHDVSVN